MATNNADYIQPQSVPVRRRRWTPPYGIVEAPPYAAAEFARLLEQPTGVTRVNQVILRLDGTDLDLSSLYQGGALIEQNKENAPDQITSGDMVLTFGNTDDTFTELLSTSSLYGKVYHNKTIVFNAGFQLPDGSIYYTIQATMLVVGIESVSDDSHVDIICRDKISRLLAETVNRKPAGIIAAAGASNTGNGGVTDIAIKPFSTVAETFTLACTLGGGDATATFSVTGSVSGLLGTATSGTEFSTGNKVKFTIFAGSTNWVIDDSFTFTTVLMMEFSAVNPARVLWSILTGYNWATNAQEAWYARTPQFDPTQNASNPDLDYDSFSLAAGYTDFTIKGYVEWDKSLVDIAQEIILHFLGAIYVTEHGKIALSWFRPVFPENTLRTFSDALMNSSFKYRRLMESMVNYVTVSYKKKDSWDWDSSVWSYDGFYIASNSTSITNYERVSKSFTSRWYSSSGAHVTYFADRLVDRYSSPPFEAEFITAQDALFTRIGQYVYLTDSKARVSGQLAEVVFTRKDFAAQPLAARVRAVFEGDTLWAFLGSSAGEGDSISPQESYYDDADADNKLFAYLSIDGDFSYIYEARDLPENVTPVAWRRFESGSPVIVEESVSGSRFTVEISSGRLLFADDTASSQWTVYASSGNGEAEFIAKLSKHSTVAANSGYFEIRATPNSPTGSNYEQIVKIFSDGITGFNSGTKTHNSNDGSFHKYRLKWVSASHVQLYVDDVLVASEVGAGFGAISKTVMFALEGTCRAIISDVWYKTTQPVLSKPNYRMF